MRRIREDARARPHMKYTVLDGFLIEARCAELLRRHARRHFVRTDLHSPFDSFLASGAPSQYGGELLFSPGWAHYLSALVDVAVPGSRPTKVMLRRHRRHANGMWLHRDRNAGSPATIGMFLYLNRGWTVEDGGLLQMWRTSPSTAPPENVVRWTHDKDLRLDFLQRPDLDVEVGDKNNQLATYHFALIEQIVPAFNRIVVCDFVSDPAYHSVTPGQSKIRYDITQRFY